MRSRLWLQIHADACGIPLYLTREPEATALGTAICAAAGAGLFANPAEASREMVTVAEEIEPNPANKAVYDWHFQRYLEAYPRLKDMMHQIAKSQA